MKNKKLIWTIIAVVVLGLLIGAYFAVRSIPEKEPENTSAPDEEIVVMDDSADTIVNIAYEGQMGSGNFTKSTGYWVYPTDNTMPVNQDFVQKMADAFIKVSATREITGQGDESAYGFDTPTLEATVMTATGHTRVYTVGAKNDMSDGYYLKFDNKIYIIGSTIVDATAFDVMDAIATGDLEEIAAEDIISVTVNGEEVPNKAGYPNIGISSVKDYKDKESYGFDGSESKVVVTYTLNSPLTDENGSVTNVSTEATYSFSYAVKDSMTYIMLPDDPCIYNATGETALFAADTEAQ